MLGFSWRGRVGLVLMLGDLKMGLETVGSDLGWMWSGNRPNSVIR